MIAASEDELVYAVASDKVAFTKWLPYYRFLLIINHGHGYMTLYGRNYFLYIKSGAVVQKGDLVATVGGSGGYDKNQHFILLFAIMLNL
ncbi:M23 family metallopeptidase [Coxiella-like endosymbiont of Rhipicephalus sanguineus]|uniref:M23 family metallopeptidase n=1 Tax=Coxiella-like endosymbiont of Rhipicephalus sanguineus TaxID=1955402 RepID=UPI002040B446|nr:M23 family metallopeptidase [Coxiella-like endosymbiont of Rhipicephalus sanguineus]